MITRSRESTAPADCSRLAFNEEVHGYYQALLARLHWPAVGVEPALKTLGVTSCYRGEGVSTAAAHLAIAAALSGGERRVLLVDANRTRPKLHRMFGQEAGPGWAELLLESAELSLTLQPSGAANLSLLTAGSSRQAAHAGDDAERLDGLLADLQAEFDLVVFDMPAVQDASASDRLASLLDGVLLVIEAERVRRQVAERTTEQLRRANVRLLGAVLNKRRRHVPNWLYRTL
jgi:capsular exopolysaccharide synthesis family protein